MADDDAQLVALIDNELDGSNRTALLARLAADEGLRRRYEEFRQTGAPLAASLDELLTQAPLARLRTALPAEEPPRLPSRRFSGITLRDLAAGLIGILAAGAAAWVALSLEAIDDAERFDAERGRSRSREKLLAGRGAPQKTEVRGDLQLGVA
jgi:anti-sigma factor RsiW